MTFSTTNLTGQRVLVRGEDSTGTAGETVLDGSEWAQVKAQRDHVVAHESFDKAVEEFFAPLTAAAEQLAVSFSVPEDTDSYVTIREGVAGAQAQDPVVAHLGRDSVVLRILEEGDHNRLVWVAGNLEVTAS